MSEEKGGATSGSEGVGAWNDAAAMALALNSASQSRADRFLEVQTALAADQRHHLHEQLKQIHLDIWEKWLGVILRAATAIVGMAFASGLAWMVWGAAHSDGLKVEPFNVPADMVARGETGQVLATQVIDRLSELQVQTNTQRPARAYTNTWGGQSAKLEIPETGISLEELDSWLREKLGHETHLTGEVVRTANGITLRARAGSDGAVTVSGAESDVDSLTARLAEAIYRVTQPYRYATWLLRHENRAADALPFFKNLALEGNADDKLWSYNMWGQAAAVLTHNNEVALRLYQQAREANPEAIGVYTNLAGTLFSLGRFEEALRVAQDGLVHLGDGKQRYVTPDRIPVSRNRHQAVIDRLLGDYRGQLPADEEALRAGVPGYGPGPLVSAVFHDHLGAHERSAAARTLAVFLPTGDAYDQLSLEIPFAAEDWRGSLVIADRMSAYLKANPSDIRLARTVYSWRLAVAQAHLGDSTAAERTIAPTPADCYPCLVARAQLAEVAGQHARADYWFARATVVGPSIPFANEAWGRTWLARGKPNAAIEKFTRANRLGARFADPLEGWGEALMAKNQSHLALEKFEEADKYAPNWGRLHLKWGEALVYAGKRDEAKAQFARAAALDLTPAEKAELARHP